ncbi:hypothetical protein B7463_g11946, partial [Scytalidium lignicola]
MYRQLDFLLAVTGVVSSVNAAGSASASSVLPTSTTTKTVYNSVPATSYAFRPGNPPSPSASVDNTESPVKDAVSTVLTTVFITTTPPATTTTIYPCADPLPSPGPAYGQYTSPSNLNLVNDLRQGDQGQNATDCCNTCFFEVENCVQAFYHEVEGCVVSQATNLTSASGEGVTNSCPAGTFNGLAYGADINPQPRTPGTIMGPCGQDYHNN